MTGTIYVKDVNPLVLQSTNLDLDIWRVTGDNASNAWDNAYGFYLRYNGTGNSNDNSLSLWANNQTGDDVEVYRVKQDGVLNFLKAPTINGTAISLTTHDHNDKYFSYSKLSNWSVVGTTKDVYKFNNQPSVYVPNGLVMGGTAAAAGLVTRGICGCSVPTEGTALTKDNLYLNYDNTNTYSSTRQVVLQAGTIGDHYGNNVYQYCAVRGDALKNFCDATYVKTTGTAATANNLNKATLGYLYQSATTTTGATGTVTAISGKIGVPIQFYGNQVNYALNNDLFYATVASNAITANTIYLGDAIKSKTFVETSTHVPTGVASGSSSSSGTSGESITYIAGDGIKIAGSEISTNTWTGTESQFAQLSNPSSYDVIYIIED